MKNNDAGVKCIKYVVRYVTLSKGPVCSDKAAHNLKYKLRFFRIDYKEATSKILVWRITIETSFSHPLSQIREGEKAQTFVKT